MLKAIHIRTRSLSIAVAALAAIGLAIVVAATAASPAGAAALFAASTLAVAVIPGVAVVAATRREVTEIEVFGFGAVVSYVLVQVLTIAAIAFHWPATTSLWLLAAITAIALALAFRRDGTIAISGERLAFLLVLALLSVLLYIQGSPYSSSEDQIHMALVRRLAFWASPNPADLYFLTGVEKGFYPYPFPAIHYFIALITRLSGLDVFFVYHKLRAFWGPAALAMAFLAAEAVFGRRLAVVSAAVAVLFVLNGTFSVSYNFFWGQLTPFSHASDVALGLLLPALIMLTMRYAAADSARDRRWFGAAALLLTGSLCIVHAREVVQQVVYLAALVVATAMTPRDRRAHLWPSVMLLAATIVVAIGYRTWHSSQIGFVNEVVTAQREAFMTRLHASSWFDVLIGSPSTQTQGAQLLFRGWNAITLLMTPLLLIAFPGRRLVRFLGLAILGYLLITRVAVFTIPYILASYFEITTSPMRNFIFFIHFSTGIVLWIVCQRLASGSLARLAGLAAFVVGVIALYRVSETWLFEHQDVFFLPLIAAWIVVLVRDWRRDAQEPERATSVRGGVAWAIVIAIFAVATFRAGTMMSSNAAGTGSPLTVPYVESLKTPRELFAQLGSCFDTPDLPLPFQPKGIPVVTSGVVHNCPIPASLIEWATGAVPVNSVVLASKFNPYPFSVYLPVRMVAWPSMELTYHNETRALAAYYQLWDESLRNHRAQPFFNTAETREDRERTLKTLGVDYVAVDPNYYQSLKSILDQFPDLLSREYDDGRWAVYRVKRPA